MTHTLGAFPTGASALAAVGKTMSRRVLEYAFERPPAWVASAFATLPDDQVLRARRLNQDPFGPFDLITTWLPMEVASPMSRTDLEALGSWGALQKHGWKLTFATQSITAGAETADDAAALGVREGGPLLGPSRSADRRGRRVTKARPPAREPGPDDLIGVAEDIAGLLARRRSRWDERAGTLEWTCRQVLEHLCSLPYAANLARRSTGPLPTIASDTAGAPVNALLENVVIQATILAEVARAAPAEARGYHPAGRADAVGFLSMAIDYRPDDVLARLVLERLFPWAPDDTDPWPTLLWANGRGPLEDRDPLGGRTAEQDR